MHSACLPPKTESSSVPCSGCTATSTFASATSWTMLCWCSQARSIMSDLRTLAQSAGLWEGVATYLAIVSDIASQYASQSRGEGIALPSWLKAAARFGVSQLRFQRNWLRIPIVPHGAHLYAEEWKSLFWNGEIRNALRLSLLPGLATAAALQYNFTGSDKGLW